MSPHRVLFLCTGNSARSQMAEALLRTMSKGQVDSFSAGTDPRPLHPLAIKSIQEIGIDISEQKSKALQQYRAQEQIRWHFDEPAAVAGSEEEQLRVFRRVRNEIRQRLSLAILANKVPATLPEVAKE